MSVVQLSVSSDEQRGYIYDVAHLLSYLYIRMGQVERARSECEKALQARRRLLGKRSDAALESTALMAHIYFLLNNRARAKTYLAMIPEARRDTVVKVVQGSLDTKVNIEHLDSSSLRTLSISEDSDLAIEHIQNRLSASTLALPMEGYHHDIVSTTISQSPAASPQQSLAASPQPSHQPIFSSADKRSQPRATERESVNEDDSADLGALDATTLSPGTLSRKEILDKIGCQPKDAIEDAVCEGEHTAFASLINRKKDFWRSMLRKRVRPERVTALHFAALFGEIDMARRLLGSSFNVNEIPYGYTTSLTPLHFAIGARQVNMVEFLIANGARPSKPDSWSTLAGQLMNRSWLMKTMSESEKKYVPSRIIAILNILLHRGWDINSPFEPSGGTLLHQAVTFWTGSYRWDLNLRTAMTSFLCKQGANPFQLNAQGKTPYDLTLASGHQDLLLILDRGSKNNQPDCGLVEPVELSSEPT